MSTSAQFVDCVNIQMTLPEAFAGNRNDNPYSQAAITQFLKSSVNTNNVLVNAIKQEGGKLRTAQVIWQQRYTPTDVTEGIEKGCAEGEVIGELSQEYTISSTAGVSITEKITPDALRQRCEADNLYVTKRILALMDAALSKGEVLMAEQIALNLGYFASDADAGTPGANSEKTVFKYDTVGGNLLTKPYETIVGDAEDNGFRLPPVVMGGRVWADYARAMKAVGLNSQGQDLAEYINQNSYVFAYSREIAAALGDAKAAVAVAPGVIQLIESNYTESPIVTMNDDALKISTMMHPALPITFDYKAVFDKCDEVWNLTISWNFDLAFLPADIFKAGDRLNGVNGINKYILNECGTLCPE